MQVEKEDRKLVRESSMISVVDTMIKTSNEYSDQFALKSEESNHFILYNNFKHF